LFVSRITTDLQKIRWKGGILLLFIIKWYTEYNIKKGKVEAKTEKIKKIIQNKKY